MSPELVGIIGLVVLIVLMFLRMWIGAAMAIAGFVGFAYLSGWDKALVMAAQTPYNTIAMYAFAAVPMFVLMGALVSNTGVGADLYNSAYKVVGQLRGGLALATIVACAMFAAICGSSSAETLTIGKVALPEMKKFQYSDTLATGSIASGGTMGILIPPSIGFLLYGLLTEQSVGYLFMAGILPGVLLSFLFILVIIIWTRINPRSGPAGPRVPFKEKVFSLKNTWATVVLFVLVLGGIYKGIFTPTEAGAIGAFGAIIITLISRRLRGKNLINSILETATTTAIILIIMAGAYIFMKFLTVSKLPFEMANFIKGLGLSTYIVWAVIIVIYLILGMFLDIMSAMVLTVPLIYPVILAMGFDPIWFGVQVVLLMEMGLITPPVGMNVFIMSSVTDVKMGTIFKGVWPFVCAMMACIIILTIFPDIALFIPRHM
jgi:C4-dicarboxylate transporter, DctM subunit